jgi:hypothetical protein
VSLLAPLWLAGLLALAVPIALHLLGRGKPPRVQLGSVRLLTAGAVRVPRRARLQRPLLLLLRCLLLGGVALALAGPRLRTTVEPTAEPVAWMLVEPGLEERARALATPARAVDGTGSEVELRWLAPGLPPVAPQGSEQAPLPDVAAVPGGLWSMVAEAAATAPGNAELTVVTSGRLTALRGDRPAVARPVRWEVVAEDRANRWLAGSAVAAGAASGPADFAPGGTNPPSALVAESDRQRTRFVAMALADGSTAAGVTSSAAPPQFDRSTGLLRLPGSDAVAGDDSLERVVARPATVLVLAGARRGPDARYVTAGLRAAATQVGRPLRVVLSPAADAAVAAESLADAGEELALLFWLADEAPPPALLAAAAAGTTLVLDATHGEERCSGLLRLPPAAAITWHRCAGLDDPASTTGPAAASSVAPSAATATSTALPAIWRSDAGRSLLVAERLGEGAILRFGGRFHPTWSELVLSPAFPEWLRGLVAAPAATAELPESDRRGDGGQGAPEVVATEPAPARAATPEQPAHPPSPAPERWLWTLVPALVVAERWLARRGA